MTNSRAKGKRNELQLSHLLQEYGYDTKRGQQFCGINGNADVVGLPHIHIEAKAVERLNIHDAMAQAVRDSDDGKRGIPTVFHKKNRTGWLVTMRFEDWMKLYKEYESMMDN